MEGLNFTITVWHESPEAELRNAAWLSMYTCLVGHSQTSKGVKQMLRITEIHCRRV